MAEHDRINEQVSGENQMPEQEGLRSQAPPPLQLIASPIDPPPESGGDSFPWMGIVKGDAWSSGFYTDPDSSSKTLDLPKGTKVKVTGNSSNWLKVEILTGEYQGRSGYISQERVTNLEATTGEVQAEPYQDKVAGGEKIEATGGKVKLQEGYGQAIFYSQEGERIFVVPANRIAVDPKEKAVGYDTIVHAFEDRGADGVKALYISYPGDDAYAPVQWYSQASLGGMVDIWSALLEELAGLIEGMKGKDWNPGKQPPNFYIGNAAHTAIAEFYRDIHSGEAMKFNSTPISTILKEYADKGYHAKLDTLSETELLARPDITNISLDNLYEIKPWASQGQAAAEVTYYHQIFLKAGIPMKLGPMSDPGTKGAMEVPGGFIVFYSPQPGVILYKKKNKTPDPYTVPEPYSVPVTKPIHEPDAIPKPIPIPIPLVNPYPKFAPETTNIWDWEYWEELTGLTGTALVIYLIVSEGTRLFPPRNAIPIP